MQDRVTELAAAEGLEYQLDRTLHLNTRDAHRVLHLALETGGPTLQAALKEALLDAYFVQARDVTDRVLLEQIAEGVGLDPEAVRRVLASDEYDAEVTADINQARAYGANGVPFFVVDGRYGISGAQPADVFAGAIERAWSERQPQLQTITGPSSSSASDDAGACGPDGCEVPQR